MLLLCYSTATPPFYNDYISYLDGRDWRNSMLPLSQVSSYSDMPENTPNPWCDDYLNNYANQHSNCDGHNRCSKLRANSRLHLAKQLLGSDPSLIRTHQWLGLRVLLHWNWWVLELAAWNYD
jgi:hypothetical protein